VLEAVGEGRFSLDDTLSHWLPGVLPRLDESANTVRMPLDYVVEPRSAAERDRWAPGQGRAGRPVIQPQ
jgi:CubicO group peptidase (beta-lactamase class C family)